MGPHTELTLDEMLADPIVHLVMRRDGLDEAQVRALALRVGRRLQMERRSFAGDRDAEAAVAWDNLAPAPARPETMS